MTQLNETLDYDLNLFGNAISYLVDASKLKVTFKTRWSAHYQYQKDFKKIHTEYRSSGITGFGHIYTMSDLADVMNSKGFTSKTGKCLTGKLLTKIQSRLEQKYGRKNLIEYLKSNYGLDELNNMTEETRVQLELNKKWIH